MYRYPSHPLLIWATIVIRKRKEEVETLQVWDDWIDRGWAQSGPAAWKQYLLDDVVAADGDGEDSLALRRREAFGKAAEAPGRVEVEDVVLVRKQLALGMNLAADERKSEDS